MAKRNHAPRLHYTQVMQGVRSSYDTDQMYLNDCRHMLGIGRVEHDFNEPRSTGTMPNSLRIRRRKLSKLRVQTNSQGVLWAR